MSSLEERFVAAVEALDRPDRDLVEPVLSGIDQLPVPVAVERSRPRGAPARRRSRVITAVAAVTVLVAAVVLVPPAREAVARWLGIGATRVVIEPGAGGTVKRTVPGPVAPPGAVSDLDDQVVIPSLGTPASVVDGPGRTRTYRWPAGEGVPALGDGSVGVQLTVRPGDGEVVTKRVDPAVEIVFVEIPRRSAPTLALWIGAEHEREAPGGAPELAQRVLVWVDDGVEYRLEADLDLAAVLALAAEIEPGTRLLAPG